jgi:replicative DNA helicase
MPTNGLKTNRSTVEALINQVTVRLADPSDMWGIAPWGVPTLDRITGGIQTHSMTVLGARPAVGKSALAAQIAINVSQYFQAQGSGKYVKVILFEMTAEAFIKRVACSMASVSPMKVASGRLTEEQAQQYMKALEDLADLPLVYTDVQGSFDDVGNFLRDKRHLTGFWILDHIGLFLDVRGNVQNQTGAIVSASNKVQELCYGVAPGLIIAHMNRGSESNTDKRPTLSNYAGSDAIGKNADLALALHRPWMFLDIPPEQRSDPQPAELLVLKNREGPTWNVPMLFNPRVTSFEEVDTEVGDAGDE